MGSFAWLKDPDGNQIELLGHPPKSEWIRRCNRSAVLPYLPLRTLFRVDSESRAFHLSQPIPGWSPASNSVGANLRESLTSQLPRCGSRNVRVSGFAAGRAFRDLPVIRRENVRADSTRSDIARRSSSLTGCAATARGLGCFSIGGFFPHRSVSNIACG